MSSTISPVLMGAALVLGTVLAPTHYIKGLTAQQTPAETTTVKIAAGPHARRHTAVSFPLPRTRANSSFELRGDGLSLPVQIGDGVAWAIVPELAAGRTLTLQLAERQSPAQGSVAATRKADDVHIVSRGRPVAQYVGGAGVLPPGDIKPIFQRGGYFHPLRTPSGRIVTGDYPPDHRHHHGVWFAWTRAVFQGRDTDFWNMGDGKGRVEFESLDTTWNGPVHAGLAAKHRYVDLTSGSPIVVLREEWVARFFDPGSESAYFTFDIDVRQTNVADAPLVLPEYHYGGMAVRGPSDIVPLDNAVFLTSEGKDRKTGDAVPSRWAYIGGTVNGAKAGVVILAHTSNFRAPEPMRIHPTDPYLCYVPSKTGNWEIPTKGTHTARYRFVAFDGAPDPKEFERLWRDYVEPPAVTLSPSGSR